MGKGGRKMDEFEAAYRENAAVLLRFLRSIGCPEQDAEDVVQDTFVKAMLNIGSFRGESSLAVWLCSIAKRTWYTKLKRQKRRAQDIEPVSTPAHEGLYAWLDLVDRLPEPYGEVFARRAVRLGLRGHRGPGGQERELGAGHLLPREIEAAGHAEGGRRR